MNIEILINAIVRQTMVLIAQLATHGTRAPLADMADQVFMSLVDELRARGLSHRVVANMFALPLSTYHDRIRRFSQSNTKQGSLWQEVLSFVQDNEPVTQARVLYEFHKDSAEDIKGILNDLIKARLLSKTGQGFDTTYEITSERSRLAGAQDPVDAASTLVWVAIYGSSPLSRDELARLLPMDEALLEEAIGRLVQEGRVMREEGEGGPQYTCDLCVLPFGAPNGWEAALFDHYQAMVKAICVKLEGGAKHAERKDVIGGSTYKFYIDNNHPMAEEVLALLQGARQQASDLRERVTEYNRVEGLHAQDLDEVVYYVGQAVIGADQGPSGQEGES